MAVNDVFRVSIAMTAGNTLEPIMNTFYYQTTVVGAGDDRSALANGFDAVGAGVQFGLMATLPQAITVQGLFVQKILPVGPVFQKLAFNNATGTVVGSFLPTQVATIISRKTALFGRRSRGRLFAGPVPLSFVTGPDPDRIQVSLYNSLVNVMPNNIVNGGFTFQPVVWSRKNLSAALITLINVNPVLKTRRSRGEGTRFHRRRKHLVGSI